MTGPGDDSNVDGVRFAASFGTSGVQDSLSRPSCWEVCRMSVCDRRREGRSMVGE